MALTLIRPTGPKVFVGRMALTLIRPAGPKVFVGRMALTLIRPTGPKVFVGRMALTLIRHTGPKVFVGRMALTLIRPTGPKVFYWPDGANAYSAYGSEGFVGRVRRSRHPAFFMNDTPRTLNCASTSSPETGRSSRRTSRFSRRPACRNASALLSPPSPATNQSPRPAAPSRPLRRR